MRVNKTIIVSVLLIMAAGLYQVLVMKTRRNVTVTRVVVGAYMLALLVSLFDLLGAGVGKVAGMLLLLAVGTMVLAIAPDLAGRIGKTAVQK